MGNKTSRPTNKTQATQAIPSGITVGGGEISYEKNEFLKIKLVQLNLVLLNHVSTNNRITIQWKENGYYCFFDEKILGKVPVNYNKQLTQYKIYNGYIIELRKQPAHVVIKIGLI